MLVELAVETITYSGIRINDYHLDAFNMNVVIGKADANVYFKTGSDGGTATAP